MTAAEIMRNLLRQGVPRELAERAAREAATIVSADGPASAFGVRAREIVRVAAPRQRGMNRTEARRAKHLESLRTSGAVIDWAYEPEKFRLADRTWYMPDFRVVYANGAIEFEDVKGRKGDRYWCEEDAKLKLKLAAELHPYRFVIVWPLRGGGWGREEF